MRVWSLENFSIRQDTRRRYFVVEHPVKSICKIYLILDLIRHAKCPWALSFTWEFKHFLAIKRSRKVFIYLAFTWWKIQSSSILTYLLRNKRSFIQTKIPFTKRNFVTQWFWKRIFFKTSLFSYIRIGQCPLFHSKWSHLTKRMRLEELYWNWSYY